MIYKILIALAIMVVYEEMKNWSYASLNIDVNSIQIKNRLFFKLHQKLRMLETDLSVYNVIFLSIILFFMTYLYVYKVCHLIVPSLIAGMMAAFIPLVYIDYQVQKLNSLLSLEVSKLVSILSRWVIVKEDIFFCFEKSRPQLNGLILKYVDDFIMHVKYSGHIDYAFDIIIDNTHHEMFRNLMINLQQTSRSKGDLLGLLQRLEEECYLIFGEHEKRRVATHFDRLAIYFSITCVLVMTVVILYINPALKNFYLMTILGNYLLSLFSVLFFLGVYAASKISAFNY